MDFARELKKLWNMRVMVILIVTGTVYKGLEKRLEEFEIRERLKTILTTVL